jgi:hypothetical protein
MKMQFLIKKKKVKIMSNETILDMINHIGDGQLNKAQDMFDSILQDKQSSALESQRISVAGQIFNGDEPDAEMEISDEEIVAEIE